MSVVCIVVRCHTYERRTFDIGRSGMSPLEQKIRLVSYTFLLSGQLIKVFIAGTVSWCVFSKKIVGLYTLLRGRQCVRKYH